ncbi:Asp23/Gls24 family envelope stress response protein [Lysinibacillus sp. 2017]|uniref:Asp23/Gls24 family envelope stress response protein n=1 Tax=unclassified Lysinibacillus TaxID=2636778 RepID=UPI000D52603C|nr:MULTISPECIES: Asp23/Gls24 family envelope stress response protein [unclassified Lysinibacillus]AWE07920.1 Asp23/Gls24 family envelope stress response protein [Lysinibacillus sp. 2017]TGN33132.1 Asp23/Gls24 family envelope stress response protein [Lysinibacillus sp. S2017]
MAEKQPVAFVQPTPVGKEELGKIEVAPEVIEVIAGIAATEVEGIASTRGNFASGVVERFGKKVHSKGIKSAMSEEGNILIDVFCTVKYGMSIPKVAKDVQSSIRQAIQNMTAIETSEVNVHITGIQFETAKDAE